jgi:nucleoid DNA-binding protein
MSKQILAQVLENIEGYSSSKAKKCVSAVFQAIRKALGEGKDVEMGDLGVLTVVQRRPRGRITRNLKHVCPTVIHLHERHPKSVKLRSKLDLTYKEK